MRLLRSSPDAAWHAIVLVRLMVGVVFLSEGLQKFLFPAEHGAGRFAEIGLPSPEALGPLVGTLETLCGALVLLGLMTRLAAIPLIVIVLVSLAATKLPILAESGVWRALHDSRIDLSMLLGACFLLIAGSGPFSLDRILERRRSRSGFRRR